VGEIGGISSLQKHGRKHAGEHAGGRPLATLVSSIGTQPFKPVKETKMFAVLSNTRNSNLSQIGALAILVIVLAAIALAPSLALTAPAIIPATGPQSSNLEFRRGEWTSSASAYQAYLDQRHGEQMAGPAYNASAALLEFRQGEQDAGPTAAQVYLDYRRGEWSGN
jgi:hypothetical protein